MIERLSDSAQKILAIFILFLLLGIGTFLLVIPLLEMFQDYDDDIAQLKFSLNKLQQVAAKEEALTKQLDKLQSLTPKSEDLIEGEGSALAGANLQEFTKRQISVSGARLESTQVLTTGIEGGLERIGIKVYFIGTINSLQRTLYSLEFAHPLLVVENLSIHAKNNSSYNRDIVDSDVEIKVSMDIYGYRRIES